ncbi:unnamed protein product [Schistosoma curassoni]|uniref:DUF6451 domain-containing protein n=1 Tax=Schistosoma curassoni TaxID=6186 RepID=A0A183JYY4_9TREM|nr:unnamed protein product [Schistosoma curassoni]
MYMKTTNIASTSVNFNILKYNTEDTNSITLSGELLEQVENFTYLDSSRIDEQEGSDKDLKERIGKVRAAFLQLKNIWNSKQLSTNIKVTIFNTDVKTVSSTVWKLRELTQPSSKWYKCL